jgi:hypothetical protein
MGLQNLSPKLKHDVFIRPKDILERRTLLPSFCTIRSIIWVVELQKSSLIHPIKRSTSM